MANKVTIIVRKLFWFFLLIFFLAGVTIIYFLKFFDPNDFRSYIVKQIEYSTKGQVKILGDLNIKLIPHPHVELRDSVLNVKLGENEVIINSKELDLDIALRPLLKKNIYITNIAAKDAKIIINQKQGNYKLELVSFLGKVEFTPCCYQIKDFVVQTLDNRFKGNIKIIEKENNVKIMGQLFADIWQIKENNTASKNTLLEILKFFEPFIVDLQVKIGTLQHEKTEFKNLGFTLTSNNHHFKLNPRAQIQKGSLSSNIDLALSGEDIDIKLDLQSKETQTTEILPFFDLESLPLSGKATLLFQGKTKGGTFAEWKANLSGDLTVNYQDILTKSTTLSPADGVLKMPLLQGKIKSITGTLSANSWQHSNETSSSNGFADFLLDLAAYNLSLEVKIKEVQYEKAHFNNVSFPLKLQKNLVVFQPVASFAQGKLVATFKIFPQKEKSKIEFALSIKNALASELFNQFGENRHFMSGQLDLDFKGTTFGKTLAQWKSGLTGDLLLHITDAKLHPDVKHISSDLGEVFHCIAIKSPIYKGVLQQKQNIGFDSSRVTGLGSGQYDFNTNQLNYYFEIVSRNKLDLSLGGTVHFVRVTGTLQNPQATLTSKEMLNQAGRITLGILTGGYSLLVEKLRDIMVHKKSACETILNAP